MSIFKRKRRIGGRVVNDPGYTVRFRAPSGIVQRWPTGCEKKTAADDIDRRLRALVEDRVAGRDPSPDLLRWLEVTSADLRERIAAIGLVDARHLASARTLGEHITDWGRSLADRRLTTPHCRLLESRVRELAEGCRWASWTDLDDGALVAWLSARIDAGMAAQTAHHYHRHVLQFQEWMLRTHRAATRRLSTVRGSGLVTNPAANPKRPRRYLTSAQFTALLRATFEGPERQGLGGPERALLWWFIGGCTGFRLGDVAALRVRRLELDGTAPSVYIEAATTKRRRASVQPIWDRRITPALRAMVARKHPDAAAWGVSTDTRLALYDDLDAAGIERTTPDGTFDIHSLRYQFGITLLRAGVPVNVVQGLMRHSTITLTMDRYGRALDSELRAAGHDGAAGPRTLEIPAGLVEHFTGRADAAERVG